MGKGREAAGRRSQARARSACSRSGPGTLAGQSFCECGRRHNALPANHNNWDVRPPGRGQGNSRKTRRSTAPECALPENRPGIRAHPRRGPIGSGAAVSGPFAQRRMRERLPECVARADLLPIWAFDTTCAVLCRNHAPCASLASPRESKFRSLADARGSVTSTTCGAATARKRILPRAASVPFAASRRPLARYGPFLTPVYCPKYLDVPSGAGATRTQASRPVCSLESRLQLRGARSPVTARFSRQRTVQQIAGPTQCKMRPLDGVTPRNDLAS